MNNNPYDISYLKFGTQKQKDAFEILEKTRVFEELKDFSPVLAGTIPLDIDIQGSDLDIICNAIDLISFEKTIINLYRDEEKFNRLHTEIRKVSSFVAKFTNSGFDFEIFCQNVEVEKQFAVIHLIIEQRLLNLFEEEAKSRIRELKKSGLKTEPAFAEYFKLEGDPYEALARLSNLSDSQLIESLK